MGQEKNNKPTLTMPALLAAAAEGCAVAEEVVDALIELQTEHAGLTAACIARSAQALMSVCHLAQLGFNGDAMSVGRTIVEISIDVSYLATDPAKLVPRFIGYAHVRDEMLASAIKKLHGGQVNRQAMRAVRQRRQEYLAQNPESTTNWAGQTLGYRARNGFGTDERKKAFSNLYNLAYSEMCGASHSGQNTLRYTISYGDAPAIRFGPEEPSVHPVSLACIAMAMLLDTAVEGLTLSPSVALRVGHFDTAIQAARGMELSPPEQDDVSVDGS